MRSRPTFWILLSLLCVAGAWLFWPHAGRRTSEQNSTAHPKSFATSVATTVTSTATAPNIFTTTTNSAAATKTNEFAYRLSNTRKSIGELARDEKAILLENALIDTRLPLNFSIPRNLQSPGDPGAYIVQAKGPIDAAFRALLARTGAEIISYIPNNAYLVRVSAAGAGALTANAETTSVIPYEPYYKISSSVPVGTKQATASVAPSRNSRRQPSLLELAVKQKPLPPETILTLGIFNSGATATISRIEKLGGTILTTNLSPFGLVLRVVPPENWTALALLPGVHIVEPYHPRIRANDLSRAITGVAVNSTAPTNYLNLYGSNVLVQVNDSGIDATHPDLIGRVFGVLTNDTVGHGTHVAGIIAGSGFESRTVTNAAGSIMPGTNGQFRGKAPLAKLFVMDFNDSDQDLQAGAALTNALISNNSWNFDGDTAYDLEAAGYDAATRDSLPFVTGSQGVLYVFSAGNDGNGEDDGINGSADSILSPATAKDVITVGAIEQQRDITNYVIAPDGSSNQIWLPETDTPFQVAGFSARGNVGIGTEGATGRYKPDVVAPGTFVISTRSQQWNQAAYYFQNPTNDDVQEFDNIVIQPGDVFANSFSLVPNNAIQVSIQVAQNPDSPSPFPDLPIFMGLESSPNLYDYETTNNLFQIPPNGPGIPAILADQTFGFNYAVSNNTSEAISIDVITDIITTNSTGNEGLVLSNLNNSIGTSPYYYRYETGTSMAAPDVSGVLALIQDYFTNTLHLTPSPALMKALLINGARPVGNYNFNEADGRNYQGWGLINLPNSVPVTNSVFYLDQSPTNALATGDSHTFLVTVPSASTNLPLRVTLAWTDPAGNPAAAIKLVNNLDLVVSNVATNIVYYGNDIPAGSVFNSLGNTNSPNLDTINPEENVFLQAPLAGSYSVTVIGRGVNVNAVTAQTNNVVQDYALAISCGNGLTPGAITVTRQANVSNPTGDQLITDVVATNAPLLNQFVGANSPLLGTNTISAGGNIGYATNALITVGMTNQWHFYIVTNMTSFTNAAFITFLPDTLSIPRMGVFADSDANSTVPEADIDLYVAGPGDPNAASLTNLNPMVISNCVYGLNGDGASLSQGGTEFVAYSNSAAAQIYYVGVKSETQMASEFAFLPVFSQLPFSQLNPDGSETVNGVPLPVAIPDGNPAHPGVGYVFGLALQPMQVQSVTVSNQITHQNFGDLIGTLGHNGVNDVLNNHDSLFNNQGVYNFLYDDSQSPLPNSQPSDGPGSLINFVGQQAVGPWILTEVDDSQSQTGSVTGFTMTIQPHIDPSHGFVTNSLAPGEFFTTFVDVPLAATNLTIFATNITPTVVSPPLELFVRYNTPPTTNNFDAMTLLNNGTPPGGSISIGATNQPPLRPGRYFFSIFNPSSTTQIVQYIAKIGISPNGPTVLDFDSSGSVPLADDAVTTSSISVTNTDPIASVNVGIRVDHPRISDLVFHLISPDGSRYLLMQNRGANTTNGAGISVLTTNTSTVPHNGDNQAYTNTINTGTTNGTITLTYDLFELPDTIDVLYGGREIYSNYPAYTGADIGGTTNIAYGFPGSNSTEVTIIINAGGNTNFPGTAWTYSVKSTTAKYVYLTFTEDTNLTTTPIKFAPPPFVPVVVTNTAIQTTNLATAWTNSFEEGPSNFTPSTGQHFGGGWVVDFGDIDVLNNSLGFGQTPSGTNFVDLNEGTAGGISTNITTVSGMVYTLNFIYTPNPNGVSVKAGVVVDGNVLGILAPTYANSFASLNWHMTNFVFTATSSSTHLAFMSTNTPGTSGVFLDAVSLTTNMISTNTVLTNLYYFPEQSITPIVGTSPTGTWQMEVQDDRVGAYDSNSPPSLVSWQLEFVLASTNAQTSPPVFTNPPPESTNMNELTTLIITNGATDANTNLTLTYSLLNPPAWATINTNTGIITLSPLEGDGPTNVIITTIVTDNGMPPLSSQNSFTVVVLVPSSPTNGPDTNIVALGSITWFQINVPTNADFATNILLFASGPLNIWFSTNSPPTITNSNDFDLIPNATNGLSILSTSSSPTNIVPGGTYFLGVQNTNSFPVTNAIEVDFHFTSFIKGPPVLPTLGTNTIYELTLLTVTNTATESDSGTTLGYTLTVNVDTNAMNALGLTNSFANTTNTTPSISASGIITWTPSELQGPGVYDITTTVTNTEVPSLSATNTFTVIVNESNSPPVLLFPTNTTLTNIVEGFPLTNLQAVATDSDIPSNTWTFAFAGGINPIGQPITNLNVTTNGLISWAPTGTNFLGTNLVSISVTDTNIYAPINKSLSVTNTFKIVVWEVNTAPFFTNNPPTNTIAILTTLVVTNTATDTDSPPNTLTYRLLTPPAGALINTNTGVITWTPTAAQGNTTNIFTNIVTDFNPFALPPNQHLSATNFFVVIVLVPPYSATLAATAVTGPTAQLNGMATPNGSPAFAWFQWGVNNSYGNQTTNVSVGSGKSVVYVTNQLAGLTLAQPYHFRLVTSNSIAVTYGFDQIFDVGGVIAWGSNSATQTNVPAILTNTAVAVGGGFSDSLALRNNARPVAWGDNTQNQTNVPVNVTNAVAVSAGGEFNLALTNNGRVVGWGYNSDGETTVPARATNVVAIASGGYHSLALRANGTVVAWGWDIALETNVPVNLSNVVAVAGGEFHSLALKNDGTVVAWGDNTDGETNVPAGLNTVVAIAAGDFYSMALKTNGTVVAWGNNNEGETNVPLGLSNVVAIAAGSEHCLALKNDGTVVAWGAGMTNNPSDGIDFGQAIIPSGLTNVVAVAGGGSHSLVLVSATPVNLVNTAPSFIVTNPPNQTINVLVTLVVTNTATDSDVPAQTLTYVLSSTLGGTNVPTITTNGIIAWTPTLAQGGTTNIITTIVTDNGGPNLSATNSFSVIVNPIPFISSVSFATNALTLHWFAPTNEQFNVQWTTNLAPVINWTTFSNGMSPIIITSPTGTFSFTDTNALFMVEFYRLVLLP